MRKRDWECPECGLVISGAVPPTRCPACGEPGELFEPVEYDMDDDEWLEEQMAEQLEDEDDLDVDELDDEPSEEDDDNDLDDEDQAVLRAVQEVFGFDDDLEEDEDLDLDLDLDGLE